MAEHVRGPPGRRAVNGVHLSDRSTRDDRLHLLIVITVAMLMADDRLHAGRVECALDRYTFVAGHGDGLLEGDQLRAALDSKLDERQPDAGRCAEAEDVRFDFFDELLRVRFTLG